MEVDRRKQAVALLWVWSHRGDGPHANHLAVGAEAARSTRRTRRSRTAYLRQSNKNCTLPSGNDIASTVDRAPPYQREQVGRNYVGLQVSWSVIFWGMVPLDDETCIVNFACGDKTWGAKSELE